MFTDLLPAEHIAFGLDALDKDAVLEALVDLVAGSEAVRDAPALLDAVRAREASLSTGVGDGLALPHAYSDAVTNAVAALAVIPAGVDFEALDGAPVHIAVLLAGSPDGRAAHVRLLSRVSRVLGQAEVRRRLLAASNAVEARGVLIDAESALV